AALLALAAAVTAHVAALPGAACVPADLGAALAVLHSLVTGRVAPTNFSQRRVQGDPAALCLVRGRFARWPAVRACSQALNFGVLMWALVAVADGTRAG